MEREIAHTEDGGLGKVKIYLEPLVRVYKEKTNSKESDKIRSSLTNYIKNTFFNNIGVHPT